MPHFRLTVPSLLALLFCVIVSPGRLIGGGIEPGRVVIAIVPMVGAGTVDDPRRPMYAPTVKEAGRDGALDFRFVLSDDGQNAIVVFSTRKPTAAAMRALDAVEESKDSKVKAFARGKAKRDEVEKEAKKHKRDFDLDDLVGAVDQKGGAK